MVEAAVTPVLRIAFDRGVDHFDPGLACRGLKALLIGDQLFSIFSMM